MQPDGVVGNHESPTIGGRPRRPRRPLTVASAPRAFPSRRGCRCTSMVTARWSANAAVAVETSKAHSHRGAIVPNPPASRTIALDSRGTRTYRTHLIGAEVVAASFPRSVTGHAHAHRCQAPQRQPAGSGTDSHPSCPSSHTFPPAIAFPRRCPLPPTIATAQTWQSRTVKPRRPATVTHFAGSSVSGAAPVK